MARLLLVHSRAITGNDQEYAAWYAGTHIGEVTQVAGFHSGRFHACRGPDGEPTGEFVAIYEVSAEDPQVLMARLTEASANMNMTDAIDMASLRFTFLDPV